MKLDISPRYKRATADMPGDNVVRDAILEESSAFAFKTVLEGKGGPFGAQLWAVNKQTGEMVLFGSLDQMQDSNAVVSKGIASAHAEAENLSEKNRKRATLFFAENQTENMDWELLQISSGESCPSCRSKQILFAQELKSNGLIANQGFNVLFKGTYEQTHQVAKFNDQPLDMAFRVIDQLGLLDKPEGLFGLQKAIQDNVLLNHMATMKEPQLIYNAVDMVKSTDISSEVVSLFEKAGDGPFAVILTKEGKILSYAADEREYPGQFEKSAIISALHQASQSRRAAGAFASWDLEGATLITNIRDIGPSAYAETLWSSLSGVQVIEEFTSDDIDMAAREIENISNREAFQLVAAEYNIPGAAINVRFNDRFKNQMPEETLKFDGYTNPEFVLWDAQMKREQLLQRQVERLEQFQNRGFLGFSLFDGQKFHDVSFKDFIQSSDQSTNYDARAEQVPEAHAE